jgi:uncharacterized protein YjlB
MSKLKKNQIPKFKNMTEEERKAWEKKLEEFYGYHSKAHMVRSIDQMKGWIL